MQGGEDTLMLTAMTRELTHAHRATSQTLVSEHELAYQEADTIYLSRDKDQDG